MSGGLLVRTHTHTHTCIHKFAIFMGEQCAILWVENITKQCGHVNQHGIETSSSTLT